MNSMPTPAYPDTSVPAVPPLPLGTSIRPPLPETDAYDQTLAEALDWLSFHRVWGVLGDEVLGAIAQSLCLFKLESGMDIYQEGQIPAGFYVLKWGTVEIYRQSPVGKTHILYRTAGDWFGYAPLMVPQVHATYPASAIAISPCELWFLSREDFERLRHTYPAIQESVNYLLAQDLTLFSDRIAHEEARIHGLQSYIHGVSLQAHLIGTSKAVKKTAQQVERAAADLQPVILQAPAGTGKTFVAGLIHSQSGLSDRPFAELNCAELPLNESGFAHSDDLFGVAQGRAGVLELLERGTLLIDQVQLLSPGDRDRLVHYLKTGTFTRNAPPGAVGTPVESWVRLVLASPHSLPNTLSLPGVDTHTIKLFSLAQRKEDIPALARHFLDTFSRERGRSPLDLSQADLRRLVSYAYPGNLSELAGILKRAVIMTPVGQSVIPEQVLWSVQTEKNAFRIDLLNQIPGLRRFLLSSWWPEGVWWIVMALFVPVTVLGFVGPQTREASLTLNLFWAWWWPFYLFLFAFVGRLWCAVCPFMITGEWLRRLSLWIWPRALLPWPTRWMNRWGGWLLFAGFLAIYLWEKLWDLPHSAYLSAWLLLVITAGAVVFSLLYERRLWCRYLCPIGGMNGMFAKLAMVELRSTQQVCGSQCSTFGCYKGSPATPVNVLNALPTEGQATEGCPLYSHPAQLTDNRDCVLCMTCLKACPNRSAQLNLRFPATDLLEQHQGFWAEAALLLLLLGGVLMHHSQRLLSWVNLEAVSLNADHLLTSLPVVMTLLSLPAALMLSVHAIARRLDPQQPAFLPLIYAYLPLTLAANLAHYTPAAVMEAGQLLPVIARTLGFSGAGLPTLTWSLDVAQFLQGVTLLSALVFSPYPLLRIIRQGSDAELGRSLLSMVPHGLLMLAFTVLFFRLMI